MKFEPRPRYPALRSISLNLTKPKAPPPGFCDVVPGRSWVDYKGKYLIITSFVNTGDFKPPGY